MPRAQEVPTTPTPLPQVAPSGNETCWSMIDRAARGDPQARAAFARAYLDVVRRTLHLRWRGGSLEQSVEDAVQDVFLDCLKQRGALTRVQAGRHGGFGAFLHGVVANVARRYERSRGRHGARQKPLAAEVSDRAPSLGQAFDQAWLQHLLGLAVANLRGTADDEEAHRRLELLSLRFGDGLALREIAARWQCDPTELHVAYARARREFGRALRGVLREHLAEGEVASDAALDERLAEMLGE